MSPTEPSAETETVTFAQLGLKPELLQVLSELGYEEPTPIQRAALPVLLEGRDLLGIAATGTGKTAAFALPLLQKLEVGAPPFAPRALVLAPTRELAMQVAEALHRYGQKMGVQVLPLYGGQDISVQLRHLKRGADVVVATPGRALDHMRRMTLKLEGVRTVVLDEADEMLDMGFAEDLEAILSATPAEKQTALFSATLPPRIKGIAEKHLRAPERITIRSERPAAGSVPRVRQTAYVVSRAHKDAALGRVLDLEAPEAAILFCRTRTEVDSLTVSLNGRGWRAQALHGGLTQPQRDRVLRLFKERAADLLVATDVAARGLDIEHITHVVNYDVPSSPETYVHRIGRTGRAGRTGVAITLAEPREHRQLQLIQKVTGQKIELATVPSVADLRARRLELTRASLHETLVAGNLDGYRSVVESLASEFDLMDVAAAAVKLLQDAQKGDGTAEEEQEIPTAALRTERPERPARPGLDERRRARFGEPGAYEGKPSRAERKHARAEARATPAAPGEAEPQGRPTREEWARPDGRPLREHAPRPPGERPAPRGRPAPGGDWARLFVGLGRRAGMRPADLVGAITGEAGLTSRDVGAIQIADAFSLVEVPEEHAEDVIGALREATIRGRKVPVRRDRE